MSSRENEPIDIHQHMNNEKHSNQQADRFSQFLFGDGNVGTKSNLSFFAPKKESKDKNKEFDWFLGRPLNNHSNDFIQNKEKEKSTFLHQHPQNETVENLLNKIDLMELMEQIDSLVTSAKQLKPIYKDVKGALGKFLAKE